MRRPRTAIAALTLVALGAGPPSVVEARGSEPKVLRASVVERIASGQPLTLRVTGRDRDDVLRGIEVRWGDGQPVFADSACAYSSDGGAEVGRRGRPERFALPYAYPLAGRYTITVRVLSGGCHGRPPQRSKPRRLTVDVS